MTKQLSEISKPLLINESRKIQKVPFQNSMMNQMINQKKMIIKRNTVIIMKIKIKMER